MKDVRDYLRRLFAAIFLCPVAAGAWVLFAYCGFSFGEFLAFLAALSQEYALMDADARLITDLEVLAGWAVLAFGFLFLSYVTNPPRFDYRLRKEGDHWIANVVE